MEKSLLPFFSTFHSMHDEVASYEDATAGVETIGTGIGELG